jgi:hypothetical protein
MEPDVNRPGADYRGFELMAPSPSACQKACGEDGFCRAWTYMKPGIQGPSARCWLKNAAPPPVADSCCVSGAIARAASPQVLAPAPPEATVEQPTQLEACEARKKASSPSPEAVYAEMQRQAQARGEPAPALTQDALAAWLRDALAIRCMREIGGGQ